MSNPDDAAAAKPLQAFEVRSLLATLGYRPPGGVRQNKDEVWFWSTDSRVIEHRNALSAQWPDLPVVTEKIRPNRHTVAIERRPPKPKRRTPRKRHITNYLMPL